MSCVTLNGDYKIVGRPSGLGGRVRQFSRHSAIKKMNVAVRGATL